MNATVRPNFIRLPKHRTNCPYTGLSRTGMYNLCVPCAANGGKPKVPAKSDRQPGNLRGVWLIPFDALIAYIEKLPTPGLDRKFESRAGEPVEKLKPNAGSAAGASRSRRSTRAKGRR